MTNVLVVDASAAVELLLSTGVGRKVADRIESGTQTLHAPELIIAEVASVLRRLVLRNAITAVTAEVALDELEAIGIETYEHQPLIRRAFDLRHAVTAYDGCYVALAEALSAPLVTCDAKLAASHGHDATIELIVFDQA